MNIVPPESAAVPPRRRPRRRRRWLLAIVGLAVAGVLAWFFVLPGVLRGVITAKLRESGFATVRVGAVAIGTTRCEVRDVRVAGRGVDAGEVVVASAVAEFGFADLVSGRIDTLVVDGVVWNRSPSPDRGVSPFEFERKPGDDGLPAATPLPPLPLRRFEVRNLAIVPGATKEPRVELRGSLEVAGTAWQIDGQVVLGEHRFTVHSTVAAAGVAAAGDVAVRGSDAAEVVLDSRFRVEPATGKIALRFDGASIGWNGVQMNGLAADLEVEGFPAPVSRAPQVVRWRELRAGAIGAGAGQATFDVLPGLELRGQVVQHTTDAAGSIAVRELHWGPGQRSFPMAISVHDVPLRDWLEVASSGRVTGDGRLSGDLSVVVNASPRLSIDLRGGHLAAAPGGVVRFLDHAEADALLREHVRQIAASTGHDSLVQERLIGALKEFRYSALEFALDRDAAHDDTTLRVHAAGEGVHVPQRLDMDVNLHGFDTALDTALAIKLGLDRAGEQLDAKIEAPVGGPPKEKKP